MKKKVFFIIVLLTLIFPYHSQSQKNVNITELDTNIVEHKVVKYALQFLGTPYKYTGKTPEGFDCSGFAGYIFKKFGIILPPSSSSISLVGEKIEKDSIKIADLVFFEGRKHNNKVGHVGIVCKIENKDIYFIHATVTSGGIIISKMKEPYYSSRYLLTKRINLIKKQE